MCFLKVLMKLYMLCLYTCYTENCRDSLASADSQQDLFICQKLSKQVALTNSRVTCTSMSFVALIALIQLHKARIWQVWAQVPDLSEMEARRWRIFCCSILVLKDKPDALRHSLWAAVVKRQYLIKLKAKYAGVGNKSSHFWTCHY